MLTDGEFDFAFAAHVLEHVLDPGAACKELARVAKAGAVECPHPFKELLFGFEETDHKWLVWPGEWVGSDAKLVFVRHPPLITQLRDKRMAGAMCRILALGPLDSSNGGYLRAWYRKNHRDLNVTARWSEEDPLTWEVIDRLPVVRR